MKYVGHGDLMKTFRGEWFMTMLAVRPLNRFTTMGRETFLAKVVCEEGCCIGIYASSNGKVSDTYVNFKRLTYIA
ncbi:MAG: hypothetical protein IJ869_00765 [Clostridiales bacterium]|nr:hypothetical protein [Clostridiales bacterium]